MSTATSSEASSTKSPPTLEETNRAVKAETLKHNREQSKVTNWTAWMSGKRFLKRQDQQIQNIETENQWWRGQVLGKDKSPAVAEDDEMEKHVLGDNTETINHHHYPQASSGIGKLAALALALVMAPSIIEALKPAPSAPVDQSPVDQGVDTVIQPGLDFFEVDE